MTVVGLLARSSQIFTRESDTGGLISESRLIIGKIKHCGP